MRSRSYFAHLGRIIVIAGFVSTAFTQDRKLQTQPERDIARNLGWFPEWERGQKIMSDVAHLSPNQLRDPDNLAYRDMVIAVEGSVVPPGGTNDLVTENGFYVRVVSPKGEDLRPNSVWWTAMIRGRVLQVLPLNKVIVIEIKENGWRTLETG